MKPAGVEPFHVEAYGSFSFPTYLVTQVVGKPRPNSFKAGVELSIGTAHQFAKVVLQNAERQAGGNATARWARGLNSLTIRPLASSLLPDEEWVTLRYRTKEDGQFHDVSLPWLVFDPLGSSARWRS